MKNIAALVKEAHQNAVNKVGGRKTGRMGN